MQVVRWPSLPESWDAFVRSAPDATVMHLGAWKDVLEQAYGLRTHYLGALGERLRGVLPLALVESRFLGRSLVSMPFMDYGGACTAGDAEAERELVKAAEEVARSENAELVLRYLRDPALPMPCRREKATFLLELDDEAALWRRLPSERRNRIRKGMRLGLTASVCGKEGLDAFYEVFAVNMRDLGSPVHGRGFFEEVMARLGDSAAIVLVRSGRQPVGAGLALLHAGMVSMPWVSSLRTWFHACPNQVLYWETIRFALARGQRVFDFGRSSRDSGGFEAKRQWGAPPVPLHWYHRPRGGGAEETPAPSAWRTLLRVPPGWPLDGRGFDWPVQLWRRLPLSMANAFGPWLRRGIPN